MNQLFSADIHGDKENRKGSQSVCLTKPKLPADGKSLLECLRLSYIIYRTGQGIGRTMSLYKMACLLPDKINFLESMFHTARDEEGADKEFLWEWADFLIGQRGDRAASLWIETGCILMNTEQMMSCGAKYAKRHPSIYRFLCSRLVKQDPELCEAAAVEALFHIPTDYKIRSAIANFGMMASAKLKHWKIVSAFCQEAFLADSSVVHYLRLFQLKNQVRPKQLAQNQLEGITHVQEAYSSYVEELQTNSIDEQEEIFIRFFSGDIMALFRKCSGEEYYYDPANTFLEMAIILMIVSFDRNETPRVCCKNLIQKAAHYFCRKKIVGFDFQNALEAWKKKVPYNLSDYEGIRLWLRISIERIAREAAGEGALWELEAAGLLVGAFCEMEASNGTENIRDSILKRYIERYQDTPLFIKELERFRILL